MNKIYYLRYGQSDANANDRVSDDAVELTELGREQARLAGVKLKDKDIKLIIVSPLIRAQQTAEIVARELGYTSKTVIVNDLNERNLGSFIKQRRPDNKNYFYEIDAEGGVESRKTIMVRAGKALKQVMEHAANTDGNVLVVGHAIIGLFMRQIAAGISDFDTFDWELKIKNGDFVEIEVNG